MNMFIDKSLYFVWSPNSGEPSKKHDTHEAAKLEARRLCEIPENHGKEFFVLRAIESVQYRTDPYFVRNYSRNG